MFKAIRFPALIHIVASFHLHSFHFQENKQQILYLNCIIQRIMMCLLLYLSFIPRFSLAVL
jgi:hypothetical protein